MTNPSDPFWSLKVHYHTHFRRFPILSPRSISSCLLLKSLLLKSLGIQHLFLFSLKGMLKPGSRFFILLWWNHSSHPQNFSSDAHFPNVGNHRCHLGTQITWTGFQWDLEEHPKSLNIPLKVSRKTWTWHVGHPISPGPDSQESTLYRKQ